GEESQYVNQFAPPPAGKRLINLTLPEVDGVAKSDLVALFGDEQVRVAPHFRVAQKERGALAAAQGEVCHNSLTLNCERHRGNQAQLFRRALEQCALGK